MGDVINRLNPFSPKQDQKNSFDLPTVANSVSFKQTDDQKSKVQHLQKRLSIEKSARMKRLDFESEFYVPSSMSIGVSPKRRFSKKSNSALDY